MRAPVLAAALLCALSASAARSPREIKAAVAALQAEVAVMEDELRGLAAELRNLTALYPSAPDLAALEPDRKRLHQRTYDLGYRINVKLGEFRELRKELQWTESARLLSALSARPEQDVSNDVVDLIHIGDDYTTPLVTLADEAGQLRAADDEAFAAETASRAEAARERSLTRRLAAGGILAGLLLGGLWRALRGRSEARDAREAALLSAASAAQAQAAQAQALLTTRVVPPARRIEAGMMLGEQYRVEGRLEDTPFGPVLAGVDARTQRKVLIKRLRDELHQSERGTDGLLEAARKVAALKHRHIAEVYGVFLEGERIHLVLERVEGRPLGEFLADGRRIQLAAARTVLAQAIKAVHHAHEQGIVHGDLTPAAVFVGEDGRVKVADFAIGVEARKSAARYSWNQFIGSPAYMAPEQELGSSFKESDFFSLGAILYEMLVGAKPFPGPDFLQQKRAMRWTPPSRALGASSPALDALVQKLLQAEPARRYHDALDLLEAVEALPDALDAAPPAA